MRDGFEAGRRAKGTTEHAEDEDAPRRGEAVQGDRERQGPAPQGHGQPLPGQEDRLAQASDLRHGRGRPGGEAGEAPPRPVATKETTDGTSEASGPREEEAPR